MGDSGQKTTSTGTVRNINNHGEKLKMNIFVAHYRIDKNATKRKKHVEIYPSAFRCNRFWLLIHYTGTECVEIFIMIHFTSI